MSEVPAVESRRRPAVAAVSVTGECGGHLRKEAAEQGRLAICPDCALPRVGSDGGFPNEPSGGCPCRESPVMPGAPVPEALLGVGADS